MKSGGLGGVGARIGATIIIGVLWLAFQILWLAFWAGEFNIWQNIAVFLASILIAGAIVAVLWITWGTSKFEF